MVARKNIFHPETPCVRADASEGKLTVAAVVPAFNEAGGIEKVLAVLQQVDCLSEIIIVDDGSDDNTQEIVHHTVLSNPRMRIIHHETNKGKGYALFTGWRATDAECLLFIDADLINLTPAHVQDLINPVRENQAQMTYGLFRGGHWDTDFSHFIAPWLTGQRCLRRELLGDVPEEAAQGYGFETALTLAAQKHKWVSRGIHMQGVSHLIKERHRGLLKGIQNRASMWGHIYRAWKLSREKPERQGRLTLGIRLLILILLIIMGFSLLYNFSLANYSPHSEGLPITYILNWVTQAPPP
jgi:glycosyltransferase involved in cell wall biosynthesis